MFSTSSTARSEALAFLPATSTPFPGMTSNAWNSTSSKVRRSTIAEQKILYTRNPVLSPMMCIELDRIGERNLQEGGIAKFCERMKQMKSVFKDHYTDVKFAQTGDDSDSEKVAKTMTNVGKQGVDAASSGSVSSSRRSSGSETSTEEERELGEQNSDVEQEPEEDELVVDLPLTPQHSAEWHAELEVLMTVGVEI